MSEKWQLINCIHVQCNMLYASSWAKLYCANSNMVHLMASQRVAAFFWDTLYGKLTTPILLQLINVN